jgi:tripartite-type tricarboxylate transporter receptor subunit TctC
MPATFIAGAIALSACADAACSQSFPTRPVTFVVPYAVSGRSTFSCALASAAERHLGRPFVIENRPSASGHPGPAVAATRSRQLHGHADQYRRVAPAVHDRTTYDPATDFTYHRVSGLTSGLVVRSDAPWKTFGELLADAKANPGKISYGSPAGAANPYIVMQQIAKQQDIKWTHIPFKSFAESSNALLGGHIHAVSDSAGWAPLVSSGQLRLLATYGSSRTKTWPVPTLSELGSDVVANSAYGIAGPRGMDAAVVRSCDAFKRGMEEPSFLAVLKQLERGRCTRHGRLSCLHRAEPSCKKIVDESASTE